jgi:hypothetical protein
MPVSEEFKANMTALFVQQRIADAPMRGWPVGDHLGTHIKQPLARPRIRDSTSKQQLVLAQAAVASLNRRQGDIQSACNSLDKTPKDIGKCEPKNLIDDSHVVKPSQIRKKVFPFKA